MGDEKLVVIHLVKAACVAQAALEATPFHLSIAHRKRKKADIQVCSNRIN